MSLKELKLKKYYDSDDDDILRDFYIPALSHSIDYKRLAGFFSSSSLAVAAKGVSKLISNGGKMELITGAKLQKADVEAIKEAYENPEKIIEKMMLGELDNLEDKFVEDHVRALGWMIANKKLEIKVAIVYEDGLPLDEKSVEKRGIFHQKVGILEDADGNQLSFSGSDNESATAWQSNIEEFKVFRSWSEAEKEYLHADEEKFKKFWEGISMRAKIIDIPRAIKEKLIEIAPDNFEELNLEKWLIERKRGEKKREIELWQIQKDARNRWFENNQGIFEMATGTGKTYAALSCLEILLKNRNKLIAVIVCPNGHLIKQWNENISKFGISCDTLIADKSNSNWRNEMADYIIDIKIGNTQKLIVLTTYNSFSSKDFIRIIKNNSAKIFLIVDEVHGVGAPQRKKGLIEDYDFRLGLSATPKRWFDLEGTEKLFNYFGGIVFKFSLKEAINQVNPNTGKTYLAPYEYKPYFIGLTEAELIKYKEDTRKIRKAYYQAKDDEEKEDVFNRLCIKRQDIIKNAVNKYKKFEEIIDQLGELKHCLIYCSPQQVNKVKNIIDKKGIIWHEFTQNEGTKSMKKYEGLSERQFILKEFAKGTYQALVAMKILDEGVDVPPARIAILLCSSGNPRQYIQRRGRILRHHPGKKKAIIHDIIVIPEISPNVDKGFSDLEKKIVKKEIKRYKEFSDVAINRLECLEKIDELEERYDMTLWG